MNPARRAIDELSAMRRSRSEPGHAANGKNKFGPHTHRLVADGVHLEIEIEDCDRFGYLIRSIHATNVLQTETEDLRTRLERQSAELAKRVTYLLEDFRPLELDAAAGRAMLRSSVPYRAEKTVNYYEVLLQGGKVLQFSRYANNGDRNGRKVAATHVTDETLTRLINDLVAVLHVD